MRRVVAGIDVGGTFTDLLLAETGAEGGGGVGRGTGGGGRV